VTTGLEGIAVGAAILITFYAILFIINFKD